MSDPMLKAMDPGDLESMAAEVERLRAEIQEAARWRRIGEAELRTEIERLRARNAELVAALQIADAAINPPDRSSISLDKWNVRLKAATIVIRAAI